jgi:tetratricopeptide (TPR) repeat protein
MRLKPKRRLILLGAAAVILAGGAFSALVVRRWQQARIIDAYLNDGLAAFHAGDYVNALDKTGMYINKSRGDARRLKDQDRPAAILAYAESRRRIELPDGHNFSDAIPFYRQYLDLRPDDRDAAITLLKTYNICSHGPEAYELARTLRPQPVARTTAADLPVLREEAMGMLTAQAFARTSAQGGEALSFDDVVDQIIRLSPADLSGHAMRLRSIELRTNSRAEARAYGDQVLAEHPDDMSALLVAAISRQVQPDDSATAEAFALVCRAAGLKPETAERTAEVTYPDAQHAFRMVELFDRLNAFPHSLAVLRDAAPKFPGEAGLRQSLVRRLWQQAAADEVIQRTATLSLTGPDADSDSLAFRALSLRQKGDTGGASAIQAALQQRAAGDFRANAWSKALPLMDPARPSRTAAEVQSWREICSSKLSPQEPVFMVSLGEVYAALGRAEEARKVWQEATRKFVAASWPLPPSLVAQSFLLDGRAEEAAQWAENARQIAPASAAVNTLWFEAQAACVQKGARSSVPPERLLSLLEGALEKMAALRPQTDEIRSYRDRLLIPHVVLVARLGQRDRARAMAITALDAQPGPDADVVRRLATTGRLENLDLDEACARRLSTSDAAAAAEVRALDLAQDGKADEAIALVRASAEKSTDPTVLLALPRLLERLGRPDATAAWARLGDSEAFAKNLTIQRACLQSTAAAEDGAFIQRTIDRYAVLVGTDPGTDDPIVVIARARSLMAGKPSRADRDRAVAMLGALVNSAQSAIEPKILLARVLSYSRPPDLTPDLPRAAALLSAAAALEPRSAPVALQFAGVLQRQGDYPRAREQLVRVTSDKTAELTLRRTAAEMLAAQGDAEPAAAALSEIAQQMGASTPPRLLAILAEADLRLHRDAEAAALFERLVTEAADPDTVYSTARYFVSTGNQAKADAALAHLEALRLDPGTADLVRARLALDRGDLDTAKARFQAATSAAPKRPDAWLQFAQAYMQRGEFGPAGEVARQGLAANPGNAALASLAKQAAALAQGNPAGEVQALIEALSLDPAARDAADALRALAPALASTPTPALADDLVRLADRFTAYPTLQNLVARRLVDIDPARASSVALRAMARAPADPAWARFAAETALSAGRACERAGDAERAGACYRDMLAAAEAWRDRDVTRPIEADVAVAEAYLRLGEPRQGFDVLAGRLRHATESPDSAFSPQVLNVQARLLIMVQREPEARALLQPLLPTSSVYRIGVWMGIALDGLPTSELSTAWLDLLQRAIPADQPTERLALAKARFGLADRFPAQADRLLQQALEAFTELARDPATANADAFQALGIVRHRVGDVTGAEEAYRRAVELNPKDGPSLNNLAFILMESRGDLTGALELAKRAVDAQPTEGNLDTLGTIYGRIAEKKADSGDADGARENFRLAAAAFHRRADLLPGSPDPLNHAAVADEGAGDLPRAIQAYETILSLRALDSDGVALVKNNLAMAMLRLERSQADLDRALTLADDAVKTREFSAFFDTRGWIQLRLGQTTAASSSFERAIALYNQETKDKPTRPDDKHGITSAFIGRAQALAGGGPAQAAEARTILDGLDVAALKATDRARYQKARQLLDAAPR